jgi:phage anti-repressor protein
MKKKTDGMSPDMFHDATSSTPIQVFSPNGETKNESKNRLQNKTDVFSGVNKFTPVPVNEDNENESKNRSQKEPDYKSIQNELIKIDFDKQTVSARALHDFLESTDRFSKWWTRMVSYGLEENVDYTAAAFFTITNNGKKEEIGDYLLTIEAAKNIAMVQRNEKGKQARNYFINIEKLYLKSVFSNKPVETPISLLENLDRIVAQFDNLRSSIVLLEKGNAQQHQLQKNYDSLIEKTIALEKKVVEQATVSNLKDEYIERTISKKIDLAVKASFREAEQIKFGNEWVNMLPSATNQNTVVVLNQLQKNLQKTTLEEDLIRKGYRPAERKTENAVFLTATDITLHLETFSKKVGVRNVGIALKKLGFERLHRGIDGYQTKGYYVIQLH